MQPSQRGRRLGVAAVTMLAVLASTAVTSADDRAIAPVSGPTVIGGSERFPQYALPASLDASNLPSNVDPESEVSATVQLAGDSALTLNATAAASSQRVDPAAAAQQVLDGQQAATAGLQAAGARVIGNVTTVLNAVRVRVKVKDLPALTGVAGVTDVHVSRAITLDNANSNAATGVNTAWQQFGVTGAGMTIAIIDDGIDYYHADFGGVGGQAAYEADDGLTIDAGTFPTTKVVAGYDFAGDAYDAEADVEGESPVPVPDPDPLACGEHGTHVSGTAAGAGVLADGSTYAGPYDETTMSNEFLVAPGSAPEALIQSYKVFGCSGSSDDDVILGAIDAAVANGADVVNMSLGSTFGTADEPLALAIDAASKAGVMMVLSAGNEGPGAYVLGGPSSANSALSVAATDAVATIPGLSITGAVTLTAQNSNNYDFTAPVTGELIDVGLGCALEDYAPAVGKIAITVRGDCDRVARAILGTQAGALAVVFVNSSAGLPPVEGTIPGATIPFVGVTPEDGALLRAAQGSSITLDAGPDIANPGYQGFASFTSNGPRTGDSALKPDISAPGVNVLSAYAGTGTGAVILSGTSMASPHTAGIAALVRQTHPDWSPAAIKAAMMSTAVPEGVAGYSARRGGAGLVDARSAVDTVAYISTKDGLNNLSFGYQDVKKSLVATRSFTITNTSSGKITYDLGSAIDDAGTGATLTLNPSVVSVPAGQSRTVWATLRIADASAIPGAAANDGGALAAIDGFVVAQPRYEGAGIHRLVTPLLMVPGGLSNVRATASRARHGASKFAVPNRIKLYNSGFHAGDADFYQWAVADPTGDSPDARVPDIRDVGVQSFPFDETGDLLVFAINTADRSTTQSLYEYDVYIDTTGDGIEDFILVAIDYGLLTTGIPDGTFTSALFTPEFEAIALFGAIAPANGSIIEAAIPAALLGNPGLFSFAVASYTILTSGVAPDVTALGYYDPSAPALTATDPELGAFPFITLAPKEYVPVAVNVDAGGAYAQQALGWLVVTTDDAAGAREADRVSLRP